MNKECLNSFGIHPTSLNCSVLDSKLPKSNWNLNHRVPSIKINVSTCFLTAAIINEDLQYSDSQSKLSEPILENMRSLATLKKQKNKMGMKKNLLSAKYAYFNED